MVCSVRMTFQDDSEIFPLCGEHKPVVAKYKAELRATLKDAFKSIQALHSDSPKGFRVPIYSPPDF